MDTGPSILIVDDNLLFSSSLVAALRRLGWTPVVADAPARVLERARGASPRAILVDLASRSLGSMERVRELKADPALASVPVIGYCGHLETELIDAGRQAGCDLVVANSAISSRPEEVLRRASVTLPERSD